jgi:hypothetical protein
MIEPTTAAAAAPNGSPAAPLEPYTRSSPYMAARPTDGALPDTAYGGPPPQAVPRRTVVTANAEASAADSSDGLPLWSPPPGTPAPSRPAAATTQQLPPQYDPRRLSAPPVQTPPAGSGYGAIPGGVMQQAASAQGFAPSLAAAPGQLPPPAYAGPGNAPPAYAASGQGPYAGYSGAALPTNIAAGHTAPTFGNSPDLSVYADDLARLQAEAAETRAQLDADRAPMQGAYGSPQARYGAPPAAPYGGASPFYR